MVELRAHPIIHRVGLLASRRRSAHASKAGGLCIDEVFLMHEEAMVDSPGTGRPPRFVAGIAIQLACAPINGKRFMC